MHFHIAADIISNLLRWSVFGKGRCRRTHTASVTSYHVNRRTQTAYVNRGTHTASVTSNHVNRRTHTAYVTSNHVNRRTHTAYVTSNHVNRRTHTASVTSNHEPEELILHL